VSHFLLAIQEKSTELGQSEDEDESGMIENKKDLNTFTNQMRYNIVLCKMSLGEREEAIAVYKQINIDLDQPFYGDFISFKKFLSREAETYKKD
jgi:spore coat protein CotF